MNERKLDRSYNFASDFACIGRYTMRISVYNDNRQHLKSIIFCINIKSIILVKKIPWFDLRKRCSPCSFYTTICVQFVIQWRIPTTRRAESPQINANVTTMNVQCRMDGQSLCFKLINSRTQKSLIALLFVRILNSERWS